MTKLDPNEARTGIRCLYTWHVHFGTQYKQQSSAELYTPAYFDLYAENADLALILSTTPSPLEAMDMAAELKLSLILVAFLSLSVSATPSSSHLTSTNDELSKDVADHENFVEQYLMQFHNRVWEVLASHGVLVRDLYL